MRRRAPSVVFAAAFTTLLAACAHEVAPTVDDARRFLEGDGVHEGAEARLLRLWTEAGRASWIQNNFITDDTNAGAAAANRDVMAATIELAAEAAMFNHLDLPPALERKLMLLRTSLAGVAPSDAALQQELADLMTEMESQYGQGEYCPDGEDECLDLPTMERRFADVRDTDQLLDMWVGWRQVAPPMRPMYGRFVDVANAGARELGFADTGEMWRSGYDMPPDNFAAELARLWQEMRPLYESLHCLVRSELSDAYGSAVVAEGEAIPAHLLGNMWGQSWANVYDTVNPPQGSSGYDLTELLERRGVDARGMVRFGERFFDSLGFDPLPATFWGALALHEARRPRCGLPRQRLEPGLRSRRAHQDVHRSQR